MMKVSDLIAKLQGLDPDLIVILATDEEGNGFSPLSVVDGNNNTYRDEGYGNGDISLYHLTPELEAKGYSDEDISSDGQRAVVLWP